MIYDAVAYLIGAPTTAMEQTLLYTAVVITYIVVFDTILDVFRIVITSLKPH